MEEITDSTAAKAESAYRKAMELTKSGDKRAALTEIKKAVSMEPKCTDYIEQLATLYWLNNDFASASTTWEQVLETDGRHEAAKANYARALVTMGGRSSQPAEKLSHYSLAAKLEPTKQSHHNNLGIVYQNTKNFAEALRCFNSGFENPNASKDDQANMKDRMATCCMELGRFADAIKHWEAALSMRYWYDDERSAVEADIRKARAKLGPN